ncbi:hypothetical protein MPTK1_5g23850 [Marchantia polymorpha subsp. ruderalis]|uniref:Uncharacterized protein n=2 Tax=Marchantia polymorpha TaxID=3197 RepID=A0AAF6BLL8_MARPO|nr:hypothetical protein MARPO_0010s0071 [Marchantia polymorpha]BBN12902.1 hypothetical protein Mp_5g23850 [Marchantia polymorpha subsp. ruderalis]|eukprot:PTQ46670.1 hypothetical protein MARPO_0010s0071 [Marchantia polymorpha]
MKMMFRSSVMKLQDLHARRRTTPSSGCGRWGSSTLDWIAPCGVRWVTTLRWWACSKSSLVPRILKSDGG